MADSKFSDLVAAGALDGTEIVAVVQDATSKQTTAQDIADLGGVSDPILLGDGSNTDPTYSFTDDPDTGFYRTGDNTIGIAQAGQFTFEFGAGVFQSAQGGNGGGLQNSVASTTIPTLLPQVADANTGLGHPGFGDAFSLIAGGVEIARVQEFSDDQFIVSPDAILGSATGPSLAFGDADTGFYEASDDVIRFATAGVARFQFSASGLQILNGGGNIDFAAASTPTLLNEAASDTNPTVVPNKADLDTGLGLAVADGLSIIAGGVEMARASEAAVDQFLFIPGTLANPGITFLSGNQTAGLTLEGTNVLSLVGGGVRAAQALNNGGNGQFVTLKNGVGSTPGLAMFLDLDTGIDSPGDDNLSLIAGGVEIARAVESTLDQFIVSPGAVQNAESAPTFAFGDGDSGFYEAADDTINLTLGGAFRFGWSGTVYAAETSEGPAMLNEDASSTNPTLLPVKGDTDTGIGRNGVDNLSLVAGGLEAIRAEDPADLGAGETSLWLYDLDNATIVQVQVGADDSGGSGLKALVVPN